MGRLRSAHSAGDHRVGSTGCGASQCTLPDLDVDPLLELVARHGSGRRPSENRARCAAPRSPGWAVRSARRRSRIRRPSARPAGPHTACDRRLALATRARSAPTSPPSSGMRPARRNADAYAKAEDGAVDEATKPREAGGHPLAHLLGRRRLGLERRDVAQDHRCIDLGERPGVGERCRADNEFGHGVIVSSEPRMASTMTSGHCSATQWLTPANGMNRYSAETKSPQACAAEPT